MHASSIIRTGVFIVAGAAFLSLAAAGPAGARPEPAPPAPTVQYSAFGHDCPLTRIGDQFVRCDNLTGAGVAAPPWVPEQR
jgi:hypothetical protein